MVDIPAGLSKVIIRAWTTFYLSNEKSETRSILTYCRQWQIHAANADTCNDRTEQTSELVGSFLKAEANWRQIGFITRKTDHQCQSSQEYDKGSAKVSSTPHWCTEDWKVVFFYFSPTMWWDSTGCSEMAVRCAGVVQPVLGYTPVEDGTDACAVGAVPVHVQPSGQ